MIRCRGPPTHVNPTHEVIKMTVLIGAIKPLHFQVRVPHLARDIARQSSIFTFFQPN